MIENSYFDPDFEQRIFDKNKAIQLKKARRFSNKTNNYFFK